LFDAGFSRTVGDRAFLGVVGTGNALFAYVAHTIACDDNGLVSLGQVGLDGLRRLAM
jgi:hypothetical protein